MGGILKKASQWLASKLSRRLGNGKGPEVDDFLKKNGVDASATANDIHKKVSKGKLTAGKITSMIGTGAAIYGLWDLADFAMDMLPDNPSPSDVKEVKDFIENGNFSTEEKRSMLRVIEQIVPASAITTNNNLRARVDVANRLLKDIQEDPTLASSLSSDDAVQVLDDIAEIEGLPVSSDNSQYSSQNAIDALPYREVKLIDSSARRIAATLGISVVRLPSLLEDLAVVAGSVKVLRELYK